MSGSAETFAAKDAQFRFGKILYKLDRKSRLGEWSETHSLLFRSDGAFRDTVLVMTRPDTVKVFGSSYDSAQSGNATALVYKTHEGQKTAIIGPGGPSPETRDALKSIMPYPCRVLGLGFAPAKVAPTAPDGSRELTLGGQTLRFVPDPHHPAQPATLVTLSQGKPIFQYTFANYKKVLPNLDLPTRIDLVPIGDLAKYYYHRFTILKADLSTEPSLEAVMPPWFSASTPTVQDYRVTPDVTWSYPTLLKLNEGKKDLSLDRLYDWSRQKSRADAIYYQQQLSAAKLAGKPSSPSATTIFAIGVLVFAFLWTIYARFAPSKQAKSGGSGT